MKLRNIVYLFSLSIIILLTSCESKAERMERLRQEEEARIALEEKIAEEKRIEEEARLKREKEEKERLEKERREKEIIEKYKSNSLYTGATPYSRYYGGNTKCYGNNCSKITVVTSNEDKYGNPYKVKSSDYPGGFKILKNPDVIVTIKQNGKVVQHAYIESGGKYTFSLPNGTYQPFFYYGDGWYPAKSMKNGKLKGGFVLREDFEKDFPQSLSNNILTYELIPQINGNFSTKDSNQEEAL